MNSYSQLTLYFFSGGEWGWRWITHAQTRSSRKRTKEAKASSASDLPDLPALSDTEPVPLPFSFANSTFSSVHLRVLQALRTSCGAVCVDAWWPVVGLQRQLDVPASPPAHTFAHMRGGSGDAEEELLMGG